MAPRTLTPAESKPDEPNDQKNGCGNPQKMHRKSCTEQNQDEKQTKYQYHRHNLQDS